MGERSGLLLVCGWVHPKIAAARHWGLERAALPGISDGTWLGRTRLRLGRCQWPTCQCQWKLPSGLPRHSAA